VVKARPADARLPAAGLTDPRGIGVECSRRGVLRRDEDAVGGLLAHADAPSTGGALRALGAIDRPAERARGAVGLVAEAHVLRPAEWAVRAAAAEGEVEEVLIRRRLVDEALLHLEPDEELEWIHVVFRANRDEELPHRLAVLFVAREDRLVAPGVLGEERVDLVGSERLAVAELLVAEEIVLVERLGDVGGAPVDIVVRLIRAGCAQDRRHNEAKQPKRSFSYHVARQCYMCAT
jgi:hypothetical protein